MKSSIISPRIMRVSPPNRQGKGIVGKSKENVDRHDGMPPYLRMFHPSRNGALGVCEIEPGSVAPVWWLCPDCDYEWRAAPFVLTAYCSHCPRCLSGCPARGDLAGKGLRGTAGGDSGTSGDYPVHKRQLIWTVILAMAFSLSLLPRECTAQCSTVPAPAAPVTVDDEGATIPNSRQLLNGVGTSIGTSTPGQISVNAALAVQALVTASTTGAVGSVYPVSTASGAVAFTLPDATASGSQGSAIVVFLKTAGNALTFDTTSGQTIGGLASGSLTTSTVNTVFSFVSDGSNWQYWQSPSSGSGGSGTVNSGTAGQVSYYASSGSAVSGDPNLTVSSGALTVGTSSDSGSVSLANGSYTNKVTSASLSGNSTCTLPNANSNSIQPLSGATTNNWLQYIDSTGTQHLLQPGFSNISGAAATSQLPSTTVNASGNCSPLFTSSISSQTQSFTLSNATGPCWYGVASSGSGAPAYQTGQIPSSLVPSGSSSSFGGNGHDGAQSVTTSSAGSPSKSLKYWTTYSISGSGTQDTYLCGSIINCNSTFSTTATGNTAATSGDINGYGAGWQQGGPGVGTTTINGYGAGGGGSVYAAGGPSDTGNPPNVDFGSGNGGTLAAIRPLAGSAGGNACTDNADFEQGGNGGGSIIIEAAGAVSFNPSSADNVANVSGAAGQGTVYGSGGGGAGAFFCYSQTSITVGSHATILSAGGAGGTGDKANQGGSGGAGGVIYLMSPSNSVSGTLNVSGGAAGTDGYAAGNSGTAVQVTDIPTLPVISLDLDLRGLRNLLQIAQCRQHSSHIILTEHEHDSFIAAHYAAPGKFWDLCSALKQENVDPRPLCAEQFFGADHKGGNLYTLAHSEGLQAVTPAQPICVVDYQVGNEG